MGIGVAYLVCTCVHLHSSVLNMCVQYEGVVATNETAYYNWHADVGVKVCTRRLRCDFYSHCGMRKLSVICALSREKGVSVF